MSPFSAAEVILEEMFDKLDPNISLTFLTNIRNYLIGSPVLLSTGQAAKVLLFNSECSVRPTVKLEDDTLIDLERNRSVTIVDLIEERNNASEIVGMKKILLVDDSSFFRKILKDLLTAAGHTVVGEAVDGIDAVNSFRMLQPEVVLMDITMPVMDGLTALKAIRRVDSTATVIMISALGQEEIIKEALKAGARDFLVKPIDSNKLRDVLAGL